MLKILLLIAAGGAVGSVLRFTITSLVQSFAGSTLLGTIVVNVLGCLAIGIVAAHFAGMQDVRHEHQAMILIGLLGAFTTFSTFGLETFELIKSRELLLAGVNVVVSNAVGLAAVWLGYAATEQWLGP